MIKTYRMMLSDLKNYLAPVNKLRRMVEQGQVIKLTKGLYETNPNTAGYLVANAIYGPSYLSFDYALSYHGLIPEMVYTYTCATYNKKKKKRYINKLGTFIYQDIPAEAYPFDILIMQEGDYHYLIASPEKALCDKLYSLKPVKNKKEMIYLLFTDLRIDQELLMNLDFSKIKKMCDLYHSQNLKILKKVLGDYNEDNYSTDDRRI